MAKLTLSDLSSLANETTAIATINSNNLLTENALDNTLSRDGTTPNAMANNLDMNSNRIYNLPDPTTNSEVATKGYVDTLAGIFDVADSVPPAAPAGVSYIDFGEISTPAAPGADLARVFSIDSGTGTTLLRMEDHAASLTNLSHFLAANTGAIYRTKQNKARDIISVKDFGAIGDGVTSDTTAVTNADAITTDQVYLPAGTYLTTLSQAAITGPYWGRGQIKDSDGNKRAPWFNAISSAPATLGAQTSVLTAFNGDLKGSQIAMEHRVTGASTAGAPTTGYLVTPEISPLNIYYYTEAGHNESTSGNDGRTGQSVFNINYFNAGQGDVGGIYVNGFVSGTRAGATHFLANPAGAIIYGQVLSGATGAYMNIVEFNANDNGFQSAAIGVVFNFTRTIATSTLGEVWMGIRPQNTGSQTSDVIYSASGLWKRGLDLTAVTFDTNKAAIVIKGDDRIYVNSASTGTVGWSQSVTNDYFGYSTSLSAFSFVVNNASAFQIYTSQVVTTKNFLPGTNDGAALGSTSNSFSDLFLASGAVLNFNNGNFTLTHSAGNLTANGIITATSARATSASAGIGYTTGAGGAVTQATSKSTAVTLNNVTGAITMNNASLAAVTTAVFVVNNTSYNAATDTVIAHHVSAGTAGVYTVAVASSGTNAFNLRVTNNTGGALAEAIVINFSVIKGATS